MLYRYCYMIFILEHPNQRWALSPLATPNSSPGDEIPTTSRECVKPGIYLVLEQGSQARIALQLTTETAPQRVTTIDVSSQSQGSFKRESLQARFRRRLIARDDMCAVLNRGPLVENVGQEHITQEAAHIFPTSQVEEWNLNYRQYITDTSPREEIGASGLYSSQNGLLLDATMHSCFDSFVIGVDPDADYAIIIFGIDNGGIGGTRLKASARNGTLPTANTSNGACAELLRWHLRMCVYRHMKANAEPQPNWEKLIGSNTMGRILEQPDAAARMEVELFTRLGDMLA